MRKVMSKFFGTGRTVFVASAPGRLDVMGGFGDYSGSWVLQMPIRERTRVFLSPRRDGRVRVSSDVARLSGWRQVVEVSSTQLVRGSYEKTREVIRTMQPGSQWAAYVLGCWSVLAREKGVTCWGADIRIESDVPVGKGVSSSAAIEVAVLSVLCRLHRLKLDPTELPVLGQMVENEVVGAPCGLMDQLTSYLGRKGHLLPILCQPDKVSPPIPIPKGIAFVGIDSGVRHAVSDASYSDVRTAAYMGYSIIAVAVGARKDQLIRARKTGERKDLPFGGYLANVSPSLFESRFKKRIPEHLSGKEFTNRYGASIDRFTEPEQGKTYCVLAASRHPIYENARVKNFVLLLRSLASGNPSPRHKSEYLEALGEMMYQAHNSYTECGIGNEVTDALVGAVREAGPHEGVFGAKITGGGSGGSVCVLCLGKKGISTARAIADEISEVYGHPPLVFSGTGDGARFSPVTQIKL